MNVLGKLMFWKKDELGLGDELAMPKGSMPMEDIGLDSPGIPKTPQMQAPEPRLDTFEGARPVQQPFMQQSQQPSYGGSNRDLELVSAKLDALKASLDNINQRLAGLERVAYGEDEHRRAW